jgi:hypothetical protein
MLAAALRAQEEVAQALPCAGPQARVHGRCGARLDLHVSYLAEGELILVGN